MDKLLYCENVCNYLNNLKGYIEDYEIKNLLWCVYGLENIEDVEIYDTEVFKLSKDVECDDGSHFYEDLYEVYKRVWKELR